MSEIPTPILRPVYAQGQKLYERITGYNSMTIQEIQHISGFENPWEAMKNHTLFSRRWNLWTSKNAIHSSIENIQSLYIVYYRTSRIVFTTILPYTTNRTMNAKRRLLFLREHQAAVYHFIIDNCLLCFPTVLRYLWNPCWDQWPLYRYDYFQSAHYYHQEGCLPMF